MDENIQHCGLLILLNQHFPTEEEYNKQLDFNNSFYYYVLSTIYPNLLLQLIKILKNINDHKFQIIMNLGSDTMFYQVYFALGALSSDNSERRLNFLKHKAEEKKCLEILELNKSIENNILENVQISEHINSNKITYIRSLAVRCGFNKQLYQIQKDQSLVFSILYHLTNTKISDLLNDIEKLEEEKGEGKFENVFIKQILYILDRLGYDIEKIFNILRIYRKRSSINKIIQILYNNNVIIPEDFNDYIIEINFRKWTDTFFKYIKYKFPNDCFFMSLKLKYECDNSKLCNILYDEKNDSECVINSKRFVVIPLVLSNKSEKLLHQNMLIYDKELKTLERFEPHGVESLPEFNIKELDEKIISFFQNLSIEQYYTPIHFCPLLGPQTLETLTEREKNELNSISGTCQVWSVVYVYYRLRNPEIPRDKLMNLLLKEISLKTNPYTFIVKVIKMFDNIMNNSDKNISEKDIYENAPNIDKLF